MNTAEQTYLRRELEQRRERLQIATREPGADSSLHQLLSAVDAALTRVDNGTFGICESCHDTIEPERLLANPLLQFCLDHLTADEQRALENDLALAARIQRALLPRPDLSVAGWQVRYHYEPAGPVSGDYCDLLESNGGLLFLLGDVAGKGVAASMLMSHLHATFRSLANQNFALDHMVEHANRIFCESTLAGQYATLVVGRAWPDGDVEFVSAGHLPLLHIGGSGTSLQEATGVPLGMFYNTRFPVRRLKLAPGDNLFLYTDGLTEAQSAAGDEYGVHRVRSVAMRCVDLEPDNLLAHVLSDVRNFSAGAKRIDDLTLLVIRRAR